MSEMTDPEWESLCDGCGFCCIHKVKDMETEVLYYTNVACRLLDIDTVRCSNYGDRKRFVPDCRRLTPESIDSMAWLPDTCGYRCVARGEDLPEWHHLKTGDRNSIHIAGKSVKGRIIAERDAGPLVQHLTVWENEDEDSD